MVNYTPKTSGVTKEVASKKNQPSVLVSELLSKVFVPLHPNDSILEAQQKLLKQQLPGSPV